MARKTYTSTAVKTRWNNRHYDRIVLLVPKGDKAVLTQMTKEKYGEFPNRYINEKIRLMLGVSEDDWKPLYIGENKKGEP